MQTYGERGERQGKHWTMDSGHARVVLIGKPVGPVALDVAAAFWQSTVLARVLYAFFSGATIVLLSLTVLGGTGVLDKS